MSILGSSHEHRAPRRVRTARLTRRESPFAHPEALDVIGAVFDAQAGRDERRSELATLFARVMSE